MVEFSISNGDNKKIVVKYGKNLIEAQLVFQQGTQKMFLKLDEADLRALSDNLKNVADYIESEKFDRTIADDGEAEDAE